MVAPNRMTQPPSFEGVERLLAVQPVSLEPLNSELGTTGERIARRFFDLCENPRTRDRTMRVLRSSARSAVGGRLLVALLSRTIFTPLLRSRRIDGAAARFELIAAQLGGIAVLRYVTRMEPVASMDLEQLVTLVAPGIQATLDAPSGDDERPRANPGASV